MRLRIVHLLAALPVVDSGIDQIQEMLQPTFGALSLLQAARGGILLYVVVHLLLKKDLLSRRMRMPLIATACCVVSLALVSAKEVVSGSFALESGVAYLRIVYWLVMWLLVLLECRTTADTRLILRGLLVGAIVAAVSILFAYVAGWGRHYYDYQGVRDSSGAFRTGKYVCGNLLVGALIAIYFCQFKHRWIFFTGALLCVTSLYLTYARAGQVALVCVIVWFVIWLLKWRRVMSRKDWLAHFVVLICVVAAVEISVLGVSQLVYRWSDFANLERAGSGRATFWPICIRIFFDGSLWDQIIGLGSNSMRNEIATHYKYRIYAHNDFLDILLILGLLGLSSLGLVWFWMLSCVKSICAYAPEAVIATGVVIAYFAQGMFTGQIFGVSAMIAYLFALTCLKVAGQQNKSFARGNPNRLASSVRT